MSANKSNEIKLVEEGKKKKRKERGGRGLIPVPTPVNQRNANKLGEQPWMRSSQSNKTFLQSGRCSPLHSCWFVHALEKKNGINFSLENCSCYTCRRRSFKESSTPLGTIQSSQLFSTKKFCIRLVSSVFLTYI